MIPTTSKNFLKICYGKVTYPRWCIMELPNEASFPLSKRYYDHCKWLLTIFIAAVVRETYSFIKIRQFISPNYNWENGVKQIQITENNLSQPCIFCKILKTKTLASETKCIKLFSLFLPLFCLYLLTGCNLSNMSSLS